MAKKQETPTTESTATVVDQSTETEANNAPVATITIDEHNAIVAEKDATIEALTVEVETVSAAAEEAIAKFNDSAKEVKSVHKTIKIGGKVYNVNYGVNLHGTDLSVEDLANNEEVVKELIEMGSGAVTLKGGN